MATKPSNLEYSQYLTILAQENEIFVFSIILGKSAVPTTLKSLTFRAIWVFRPPHMSEYARWEGAVALERKLKTQATTFALISKQYLIILARENGIIVISVILGNSTTEISTWCSPKFRRLMFWVFWALLKIREWMQNMPYNAFYFLLGDSRPIEWRVARIQTTHTDKSLTSQLRNLI